MIERKNIINLLSDRTNVYHSALLTTYSFDPIYFEAVYLSTLRKLGITNIVVLMDANMYDQLLSDSNYSCHKVSQINYTLIRKENRSFGVFHPKMVLLFGEEEGALIVGSGNLTYSGLSNNEEVWNVFHVLGDESIHYPLFYKAWLYCSEATSQVSPLVVRQKEWMIEQSPWLHKESNENSITLISKEDCSLLFNTQEATILNSLYSSIGKTPIKEITVVAPFFDTEGRVLLELQKHFSPESMLCVMDVERQSAPFDLLEKETNITFCKSNSTNPLHAKIIELRSEKESWLISGSANAGNMALGTNHQVYNDEACILLHSKSKRDYIKDLGLHYSVLTNEEKKKIERPKQEKTESRTLLVKILSCEEKDEQLYIGFSKPGIKGSLTILDQQQNVVFRSEIVTGLKKVVSLSNVNIANFHIAVFKIGDEEISNRLLVVREINVERGNPDPKRRQLSRMLDDPDLLENLSHILGYIEFDETRKKIHSVAVSDNSSEEKEDKDIIVTRDRFNELKDTTMSISMHSGVRILTYLQQILFNTENSEQTDDDLLALDTEGSGEVRDGERKKEVTQYSDLGDVDRMRTDIVKFLKRMLSLLQDKTKDKTIYGEIKSTVNHPCLLGVPGLNAASAIAVASSTVVYMMNKYGSYIKKKNEIRDLLLSCSGYFFSLYSNKIPSGDTLRNRKTRELLSDATVNLFSALSFFVYDKNDCLLPQLILNYLEMWKGQSEINDIIPLYKEQLMKLNDESLNIYTITKILKVASVFLSKETPIKQISLNHKTMYFLRKGYGFLIIDNLKRTYNGWSYTYHSPWFDDKIENTTATKFKGYYDL